MEQVSDEELSMVTGGTYDIDRTARQYYLLLTKMGLNVSKDFVKSMILKGGYTLREWVKSQPGGEKKANLIPSF